LYSSPDDTPASVVLAPTVRDGEPAAAVPAGAVVAGDPLEGDCAETGEVDVTGVPIDVDPHPAPARMATAAKTRKPDRFIAGTPPPATVTAIRSADLSISVTACSLRHAT